MSKDQLKIVLAMVLILLGTCTTLKIMMTSSYVGIPKCHALMFLVCWCNMSLKLFLCPIFNEPPLFYFQYVWACVSMLVSFMHFRTWSLDVNLGLGQLVSIFFSAILASIVVKVGLSSIYIVCVGFQCGGVEDRLVFSCPFLFLYMHIWLFFDIPATSKTFPNCLGPNQIKKGLIYIVESI